MPDQALHAPERFGERKDAGVLRESLGPLHGPELDRNHAAEPLHLPAGKLVLGVGWQPRVVDPLDLGMFREPLGDATAVGVVLPHPQRDRKSTRLNSSHGYISYAVFCLKKKKNRDKIIP